MNYPTQPLISIITPSFNSSRFIKECIESILNQTYRNIEHIIQDGASTDGTVDIIKKYSEKYSDRIVFRSEPDKGQSEALNKAIQLAKGDILLVLNADDALMPQACAWAVKNMAKYPEAAVVYGDVHIIDEHSKFIESFVSSPYDFESLLCVELVPPAQGSFIRRVSFEKVGFYADKNLDTCPDYEMWIRIGLVFPMKKISGFIAKYRKHYQAMDSKQQRTVKRFFDSKKMVMDRVFNSPRTPELLEKLRYRAYSGLVLWTVKADLGMRHTNQGLLMHYLLNLGYYSRQVPIEIPYFFRKSWVTGILFVKRLIRRNLKAFLIKLSVSNLSLLEKISRNYKWKKLIRESINEKYE